MPHKYFAKNEAETLMGVRIRTLAEFSGIPRGEMGTVLGYDKSGRNTAGTILRTAADEEEGYTVAVQWDSPWRTKPLVDWFNKTEFDKFIQIC